MELLTESIAVSNSSSRPHTMSTIPPMVITLEPMDIPQVNFFFNKRKIYLNLSALNKRGVMAYVETEKLLLQI